MEKRISIFLMTVNKFISLYPQVNPNHVIGKIPFVKNGVLYPWSDLDPGTVRLAVAVMPDCQHLLQKNLITDSPPQHGPVLTVFSPRSFR